MGRVILNMPWLTFDLGAELQVLSWAVNRPGIVRTSRILWREVRNGDLPPELDVCGWIDQQLVERGMKDDVLFLTSRNIARFEETTARVEEISVHAVATVGLSNGERVGSRVDYAGRDWGTINVALQISEGMTETALLEAMSIAVQARTAAVMDAGYRLPTGLATGTGTDCVAVAAPEGRVSYAGLHTPVGEAIGQAVYASVRAGADNWLSETEERQHARV